MATQTSADLGFSEPRNLDPDPKILKLWILGSGSYKRSQNPRFRVWGFGPEMPTQYQMAAHDKPLYN